MKIDFFNDQRDYRDFGPEIQVHPTAIVAKTAELSRGVKVGAFAQIGPSVKLAENVEIGPSAIVTGRTSIGAGTKIFSFATLGTSPQDLKYDGEPTELELGSGNLIREYANISVGTKGGGGVTRLGDNNLVMAYTHIAHDCHIGSNCIFANGVQLAGHVSIEDSVVFGGMSGGHQFCSFGEYAMVGAGAIVVQDVPPYLMVQGDRATVTGLNVVGLRRAAVGVENLSNIKKMFRILYKENLTLEDAKVKITEEVSDSEYKAKFLRFLSKSERGICR